MEKQAKNSYQPQINSIRKAIHSEDRRLRAKYWWLEHQNIIGTGFFVGSLAVLALSSWAYAVGSIAWYTMLVINAIAISILHELEHDIIHELYFKKKHTWMQHVMFFFIWYAKLNANPWWRKAFHLKHHKVSGQVTDVEERLIGLGYPLGLKRLLITVTPLATPLVAWDVAYDSELHNSEPKLEILKGYTINLPTFGVAAALFFAWFFPSYFSPETYFWIDLFNMCLFLPNTLRQTCLQIVSTGCHFYGDIPEDNVFFQNQVLNHWIFYPLQAFCFNFGETHILHHYVTRQPFYLRQMAANIVLKEMRKQGVRFNDLEIFNRDHRFYRGPEDAHHPHYNLSSQQKAMAS